MTKKKEQKHYFKSREILRWGWENIDTILYQFSKTLDWFLIVYMQRFVLAVHFASSWTQDGRKRAHIVSLSTKKTDPRRAYTLNKLNIYPCTMICFGSLEFCSLYSSILRRHDKRRCNTNSSGTKEERQLQLSKKVWLIWQITGLTIVITVSNLTHIWSGVSGDFQVKFLV